jgi:hypothetical protein
MDIFFCKMWVKSQHLTEKETQFVALPNEVS